MPWRFTGETARHFHGGAERMDLKSQRVVLGMAGVIMSLAIVAGAQTPSTPPPPTPAPESTPAAAPAAAAPAPLSTFVLTGPLQWLPPAIFDAGPLGKLSVNGIVTGFAQFQNSSVPP